MSTRSQMLCVSCGPAALILILIGFWPVAGFVPPPSPHDSAQDIVRMYADDRDAIRLGLVITMLGGALIGPFVAVISAQMKRIEGHYSPLAYTQLGLGMVGVLVIILPMVAMETAAFRAERDPQTVLALNDFAWLFFVGVVMLFMVEVLSIAVCVLRDEREEVFPRWLAYFNVWAALLLVPAGLIYFLKTGPFAWNGIFVFWLGLTVLGLWFVVMTVVLHRAIRTQSSE